MSDGLTKAKHWLEYKSERCGEHPSAHITMRVTYSLVLLALAVSASASCASCPAKVGKKLRKACISNGYTTCR